ncbi:MAG: helix-turn-helix domain-containing protein [Desulfovibrio sp.]|jgi:excisionase family DNA binding protein|nr:helix-turn-helix domain-containing protein [Desulfovibrio sp.]
MNTAQIKSIIALVKGQWRPYDHEPQSVVYEKLKCPHAHVKNRRKPFWFVRGDIFTCVGCSRGCTLSRPEGFCLPIPIRYPEKPDKPYHLTPAEMVERKALLRVDEAAYCLNISERTLYEWIAVGKLRKAKGLPLRVAAGDVASYMTNFEE